MAFISELYQTGFLNIRRLWCIAMAKRVHGQNLSFLLKFAAAYYKDKPAISDGDTTVSFKELYKLVLQCSAAIQSETNCKEGDTFILLTENIVQHIITFYAIQNLGLRLVVVNTKAHINEIEKIKERHAGNCFILASEAISADTILLSTFFNNKGRRNWQGAISKKYSPVIYTTSGTTGAAKMIEKRKGAFYWLRAFTDLLTYTGIHRQAAVFIAVPVSHGFGSTALLFALVLGKKAVVAGSKNREQQAALLQQEKTSLVAGVPASLYYLAEILQGNNPVKLIISGGAPFTKTTFQKISACFGQNIFSMYGSTEASTSFVANYAELEKNIHALGRPLKNVHYKLVPLTGGGAELLIHSKLANAASKDGWLQTGDLVKEEDDLLVWCGRKDDMIIKGGVNIYPSEIEAALLNFPGVAEVLVCGRYQPVKGQVIVAYVQPTPGQTLQEDDLKNSLRQHISGIKIPDTIVFVTAFAYTHTGKKIKPTAEGLLH